MICAPFREDATDMHDMRDNARKLRHATTAAQMKRAQRGSNSFGGCAAPDLSLHLVCLAVRPAYLLEDGIPNTLEYSIQTAILRETCLLLIRMEQCRVICCSVYDSCISNHRLKVIFAKNFRAADTCRIQPSLTCEIGSSLAGSLTLAT